MVLGKLKQSYKSVNYPVRIFVVRGENKFCRKFNCLLARELSCKIGLVEKVHEITDHEVFGDIGLLKFDPEKYS